MDHEAADFQEDERKSAAATHENDSSLGLCTSLTLYDSGSSARGSFWHPMVRIGDRPRSLITLNDSLSTFRMTSIDPPIRGDEFAAARFEEIIEPRLKPSNYDKLPSCFRWVEPEPFSEEDIEYGNKTKILYIHPLTIAEKYYPSKYFGIRQAYKLHPGAIIDMDIRRGTIVIVEKVFSQSVGYRVNRARLLHGEIIDIEVVALDSESKVLREDSLTWAPISVEVPLSFCSLKPADDAMRHLKKTGVIYRSFLFGTTSRFSFGLGKIVRYEERSSKSPPQPLWSIPRLCYSP